MLLFDQSFLPRNRSDTRRKRLRHLRAMEHDEAKAEIWANLVKKIHYFLFRLPIRKLQYVYNVLCWISQDHNVLLYHDELQLASPESSRGSETISWLATRAQISFTGGGNPLTRSSPWPIPTPAPRTSLMPLPHRGPRRVPAPDPRRQRCQFWSTGLRNRREWDRLGTCICEKCIEAWDHWIPPRRRERRRLRATCWSHQCQFRGPHAFTCCKCKWRNPGDDCNNPFPSSWLDEVD